MKLFNLMRTGILLLVITSVTTENLQAQSDLNLFIEMGRPQGAFNQNTKAVGLGFGAGLVFPIDKNKHIMIGGEFSYEIYGKEIKSDRANSYDLITNNNIFMTHAVIRITPFSEGILIPYIDLKGGLKNFYTKTKVKDDVLAGDATEVIGEFNDVAGSYGGAFGVRLQRSDAVSLFADASFLAGGRATYVDRKSFERDPDGVVSFDSKHSRTNMVLFRFGVTLHPGGGEKE